MESNTRITAPNSLFRPLTRLTSGADHRIFIEDCVESQLDGFTDPPLRDCSVWSSKPFVFLDLIWNLAFAVVSIFVLVTTIREKPSTPLRVWIGGYTFQCLLHVGFVYLDYRRWNRADLGIVNDGFLLPLCHSSVTKNLQSVNTVISSIWWVFGFYWIVVGGQALMQDSPHLYWLAVIFLAFEVFFVIFCIGMACIVFFTMFCCFPIVATIAYAMAIQEGASESDLRTLPKLLYSQTNPFETLDSAEKQDGSGLAMEPGNSYSTPKLALHPEDSECCICLHRYVEGVELCTLPCNHHFHHECISKWLRINATCPLCKHSIFRGEMLANVAAVGLDKDLADEVQQVLHKALDVISSEKQYQERCLSTLTNALESYKDSTTDGTHKSDAERVYLSSKYQLIVSSALMTTLPRHFPEILHWYFKRRLEELSTSLGGEYQDINESQDKDDMDLDDKPKLPSRTGDMETDACHPQGRLLENNRLVKNIGKVVHDLRSVGFTSMAEDAYASAIFMLLKAKVNDLAGDDYRSSVLEAIKGWIQAVPLQFLHALLAYLGDSVNYGSPSSSLRSPLASRPSSCYPGTNSPSEGLVRWQLRLEYFAYETLQDLRIAKLFEIIVDYPDSSAAIEDLKQCLEHTGQHSKLVDSFISALQYRLLTAGASTNDILHQYVSTIKALRTIDPAGVFLEAVGEPIREYLRGRKDTIKCIVTMLTGGSPNGPGNIGDSLLEELNRDEENQDSNGADDDMNTDDKQAWIDAERWEPDPVEADPLKGNRSRRKVDILGMIVGIIGSKDQLVNEYRVMLAEKLLNKTNYDIDSEIRTLELLKIHFGDSSMQRCEIMLNDLIDSKRTNTNVKATIKQQYQSGFNIRENGVSLDVLDATIISSNFWPPIQEEALNIPGTVDKLLNDYATRFNEIKTPRKLLWKKNLGTVKLELQFEDREVQFMVTPVHASIIMQFQDQTSWTSKNLAAAIGVPVDVVNRRISFWISKGILAESMGTDSDDHIFTLVDGTVDSSKTGVSSGSCEELTGDEDGDKSVAFVEDQLHKEMTVYEKFITGMLTNFGSMALDRIHNTLKMFCVADPAYDKSLQQLQSFLSGLVAEEKLEIRDGMYFLKK